MSRKGVDSPTFCFFAVNTSITVAFESQILSATY